MSISVEDTRGFTYEISLVYRRFRRKSANPHRPDKFVNLYARIIMLQHLVANRERGTQSGPVSLSPCLRQRGMLLCVGR